VAFIKIAVRSYSGYKLDERPSILIFQDRSETICDIIDRWYEGGVDSGRPVMNYFRIRTEGGSEYIVRYNPMADQWEVLE
jgi:hypothetical protein